MDDYTLLDQIGLGTFGKVFQAVHRPSGQPVALKLIRMETEREGFPVTAVREAKLLRSLDHPHCIKLNGIIRETPESVYFCFDYYEFDLVGLMGHLGSLTRDQVRFIGRALVRAMSYLHTHDILHRDVKPSNLLLSPRLHSVVLGDFGLAKKRHAPDQGKTYQRQLTNRVVTLWYRAPELLLGASVYGFGVDVWAAGCVLWEMVTGTPPFTGNDEFTQLSGIVKKHGPIPHPLKDRLPFGNLFSFDEEPERIDLRQQFPKDPELTDLLGMMLEYDPDKRISAKDCLKHPFFNCLTDDFSKVFPGLQSSHSKHEFEVRQLQKNK